MMNSVRDTFRYEGPIFDAHSHVVDCDSLSLLVKTADEFGVRRAVLIVHHSKPTEIEKRYPERFIFAKYFSGTMLLSGDVDRAIKEAARMAEEGFTVAKMHFSPVWATRLEGSSPLSIDSTSLDPFFDFLQDENIPSLIHIADPDTYYRTRYADTSVFGTKEEHLRQFEARLERTPRLRIQVAHFAAQPEPHRLDHLGSLLDRFRNVVIDTGSARWMVRELGREPRRSRDFITKYRDRILFGSDCVARTTDRSYFEGRFHSLRMLMESNVLNVPLPFVDEDTVKTGGTFINGLCLPDRVLSALYWDNASTRYDIE